MRDEKKFAVLIDAENVSSKYIKYIFDEISNYGIITYKRGYGDWTKPTSASWKEILLDNSITPIQQYSYTTGKNSSDSAMIIDAMDILYSNNVDGFCLVSSDSDFTKLAQRLRESGMTVIGMGEEKTPRAFSAACNIFKYVDILSDEENKSSDSDNKNNMNEEVTEKNSNSSIKNKESKNMTDKSIIEDTMIKIITEYGDEEKGIGIGELGSRLVKRYPDFDVRNYGYTKLSKFITSFKSIALEVEGKHITAHLMNNDLNIDLVETAIIKIIKESKNDSINMGELSRKLRERNSKFNVRKYGYTKFSQLINDLSSLKIVNGGKDGSSKNVAIVSNKK